MRQEKPSDREEAREVRTSLAFYVMIALLCGEFIGVLLGRFNYLLTAITGAIIMGILFGPQFPIEFFRALRGSRERDSGEKGDADDPR